MGGAIFTLADFACAVASNVGEEPTVSVAFSIQYLSAVKGKRLIATADARKNGRTLGFYDCTVRDDLGRDVAHVTGTCMHTAPCPAGAENEGAEAISAKVGVLIRAMRVSAIYSASLSCGNVGDEGLDTRGPRI